MSKSIFLPLAFAILCPFFEALMNITDKYVISNKVRRPASFAVIEGAVILFTGIVLTSMLNWRVVSSGEDILFPAIAGIIYGSQFLIYYYLLVKEDVSNVIGLIYLYPIVVAALSFVFLGEKLSLITYAGLGLILMGGVMLSVKANHLKIRFMTSLMVTMILLVGLHEFFIKVATTNLPELHGFAISLISIGLTLLAGLLHKQTRQGVRGEFKNLKWAVCGQCFALAGLASIYYAMAGLPATIVAAIGGTQPLIVLFLEKICHAIGIKICSDARLMPKLIPISFMVVGIVMLYEII